MKTEEQEKLMHYLLNSSYPILFNYFNIGLALCNLEEIENYVKDYFKNLTKEQKEKDLKCISYILYLTWKERI